MYAKKRKKKVGKGLGPITQEDIDNFDPEGKFKDIKIKILYKDSDCCDDDSKATKENIKKYQELGFNILILGRGLPNRAYNTKTGQYLDL
jgi:hypothetical protein